MHYQNDNKRLNYSIQDNIELLELALKHSINWSIENRQNIICNPERDRNLSEAESIAADINDDTHIKAFVTQFKIELNHLMGLKLQQFVKELNENYLDDSFTDQESFDSVEDVEVQCRNVSRSNKGPRVGIDGKHCDLYNINENTDVDDVESYSRAVAEQVLIQRKSRRNRDRYRARRGTKFDTCQAVEEDFDGGYGSLSRGSFKSSPDLVQQLHDLRSRLIDLVHELDESIENRLPNDQLESYRRRRDALMSKIDSLIDCYAQDDNESSPVLIGLTDSESNEENLDLNRQFYDSLSSQHLRDKSRRALEKRNRDERNYLSRNEYEEQVHIIDYDYNRRSSCDTNSEAKSEHETRSGIPNQSNSSNLLLSEHSNHDEFIPSKYRPIDFGAMMRNYEGNKETATLTKSKAQQVPPKQSPETAASQHVPSTSSTSTSSHISSSSSSFL